MTRAATPAVSGADSLVPPPPRTGVGWPAKLTHSAHNAVSVEHRTQLSSPGATRSMTDPVWLKPLELNELMLSLR